MRIQDIFISVIVLSFTIIVILLQYNLIKVYEYKYGITPLAVLIFAETIRMEKLLYAQYLYSKDPNYLFYFDSSIKDNFSIKDNLNSDEGTINISYCLKNCPIKKYFSISCGEVANATYVTKDDKKILKIRRYEFCSAPAFTIEKLSSYLDKEESEKSILSIYKLSSIVPYKTRRTRRRKKNLKIYWNYSKLLEAMSNLKEGKTIVTGVFNAKIPILLTDKYGILYKIHPTNIGTIKLVEVREEVLKESSQ